MLDPALIDRSSHSFTFCRVGEEGEWDVHNALVTMTNATSSQVIGLLPYTVYSFRVVAVNALGPSTPSRESYYMVTLREGKKYLIKLIRH